MNQETRDQLKRLFDQMKRQEIAHAHGRDIPHADKLAECEWCGAVIPASRRFCDQACINAGRQAS
jgi:hypothetical protein